jgi:mannan endo-1,4-beta-mannosidase
MASAVTSFVERHEDQLLLNGERFRIVGANIYYLGFSTEDEQNRMLDLAEAFGFNVLRIWAFLDLERMPGEGEVGLRVFAPGASEATVRDGPDGLERLDRAIQLAGQRGMRVILTLTNGNKDYGGLPLHQRWLGLPTLNEVYRDARAKSLWQSWAETLTKRTNRFTGVRYCDDPAILAWEIANEPRCPARDADASVLTGWLSEMSRFLKAQAPRQLVSAGDEGFFRHARAGSNWFFNGSLGVSTEEILGIPEIDFGTYHMYPDFWLGGGEKQDWQKWEDWGAMWIQNHIDAAKRAAKPMLLEEYGLPVGAGRDRAYATWLAMIEEQDTVGDLVWMLGLPTQGDRYLLTRPDEALPIVEHAARMLGAGESEPGVQADLE